MTQHNSAKGKKRRKKPEKLEFVQDFIPIKDLHHGIIETTDGRYIIIIFRYDSSYLVKRIAACEGDTLVHQNAIVTVPENCFYVLGDNAEDSHDSRYWDNPFVSYENVIAKLLLPIK